MKHCFYLFSILFLIHACSCPANKNASSATIGLTSLEWRLVSLNIDGKNLSAESLKMPATLKINNDGQFSGTGGCNNFFGQVEFKGKNIKFSKAGITQKMCLDETATTIETAYMKVLAEVDSYIVESGNLKLKKGNTVIAIFSTFR